jgi:hypothetical protein
MKVLFYFSLLAGIYRIQDSKLKWKDEINYIESSSVCNKKWVTVTMQSCMFKNITAYSALHFVFRDRRRLHLPEFPWMNRLSESFRLALSSSVWLEMKVLRGQTHTIGKSWSWNLLCREELLWLGTAAWMTKQGWGRRITSSRLTGYTERSSVQKQNKTHRRLGAWLKSHMPT